MNIYINFVIFRTRGKHRKMFSAENISGKITSLKIFFDGNYFTSK
jgi:hypothetical protein